MRIRSTVFAALLLSAALAVPAAPVVADADETQEQGKAKPRKDKDTKDRKDRAAQDGCAKDCSQSTTQEKKPDQDGREPEPDLDDNDLDNATGDAMRFQGLDRDGDGRITRAEWRGNETSFRQHDANGDGFLAGKEITPGEPLTDDEDPSDDWQEWWNFHAARFESGAFQGMDQDHNQVVAREEWAGSFTLFDRLDRDHNGALSQEEYENRELRGMTRESLFVRLDTNGNGRLDPAEWWWSRDAYTLVDRDSNGWISREEFLSRGETR